jgi:predicted urease superfamily metal-dependent hydrolase
MHDFYTVYHKGNIETIRNAKFNSLVLTAEESGTTIGAHPAGVTEILNKSALDPANPTNDERTAAIKSAVERYLAVAFLLGADWIRYGTLVKEIENEFLRNKGSSSTAGTYPTSMSEAYLIALMIHISISVSHHNS